MKQVTLQADQATDAVLSETQLDALIKLTAFTTATNYVIDGCGCCGSPGLSRDNIEFANDLHWEGAQYSVRLHSSQLGKDVFALADGTRYIKEW